MLAVAVLWGIVFPRLAETESVRRRTRLLERSGVDPAAFFYTDLPLLDVPARRTPP